MDKHGVNFIRSLRPLQHLQHLHIIAEPASPGPRDSYFFPTSEPPAIDLDHGLLLGNLPPSVAQLQLSILIDPRLVLLFLRQPECAPRLEQMVLSLADLKVTDAKEREKWRRRIERECGARGIASVRWVESGWVKMAPTERPAWDDEDQTIHQMDEEEREEYFAEMEDEEDDYDRGEGESEESEESEVSEGSEVGDW